MKNNPLYDPTREFEAMIAEYTGAPHVVAVDSCMSALYLALELRRKSLFNEIPRIPTRTYPCVAQLIQYQFGAFFFDDSYAKVNYEKGTLTGAYPIFPFGIWDSALSFQAKSWNPGYSNIYCLSFTGPKKYLQLSKAGAILCEDKKDAEWFKIARFGGRHEMDYHEDTFDFDGPGLNMYLLPEIALQGIRAMQHHMRKYNVENNAPDLTLPYPDLSQMPAFK